MLTIIFLLGSADAAVGGAFCFASRRARTVSRVTAGFVSSGQLGSVTEESTMIVLKFACSKMHVIDSKIKFAGGILCI